jgi:hypothetical protein
MEKVYVIKDVFSEQYYRKHENEKVAAYMGGGLMTFWDENLIKFARKEDAEDVIKNNRTLNNVIILEVYTR